MKIWDILFLEKVFKVINIDTYEVGTIFRIERINHEIKDEFND